MRQSIQRRSLLIASSLLLILALIAVSASLYLYHFVEAKGPSWLESQAKKNLGLDLHIGSATYSFFNGITLKDINTSDKNGKTIPFESKELNIGISFLPWLLKNQLNFKINGPISNPFSSDIHADGTFLPDEKQLDLNLKTGAFSLDQTNPKLRSYAPTQIKDAKIRLEALKIIWKAGQPIETKGKISLNDIEIEYGKARLSGNAILEGLSIYKDTENDKLRFISTLIISDGIIDNLPIFEKAEKINGRLELSENQARVLELWFLLNGNKWQVEGEVSDFKNMESEILLSGKADLGILSRINAIQSKMLDPKGTADMRIVCRGPLIKWPNIEIQASAGIQNSSISMQPPVDRRIENIEGKFNYDHLTRNLELRTIAGDIAGNPIKASGNIRFTSPLWFQIAAKADLPLEILDDFIHNNSMLNLTSGNASLDLALNGNSKHPNWQGVVDFSQADISFKKIPVVLKKLNGKVDFSNDEISSDSVDFTLENEPVRASFKASSLTKEPHVMLAAQLSRGSIRAEALIKTDYILLENSEISILGSELNASGNISLDKSKNSQIQARGVLELSELAKIPWFSLEQLDKYNLSGKAYFQSRIFGPYGDFASCTMQTVASSEQVRIGAIPIRKISIDSEQSNRKLFIRLTESELANGRFLGEFILDRQKQNAPALFEFDLIQSDLAQLSSYFSKWEGKNIQGIASAHLNLMKLGAEISSLQGSGWIQAKGDYLGEIPLLDRLFRGLVGALADRIGLSNLRSARLTETSGKFKIMNKQIITDNFRMVGMCETEPLDIYVKGAIGFDKTLDLVIEPQLTASLLLQSPDISGIGAAMLKFIGGLERLRQTIGRHHLGGTIENPKYSFEFNLSQALNQFLPSGF